ncbi:MAG: hypothetical protein SX243_19615 [Acidobacteriota bacterium]|nr:hypothetical protein [Acidobacteriota bacterium]
MQQNPRNPFLRQRPVLWLATALLVAVGIIWILIAPARQQQKAWAERFEPLRLGMSKAEVIDLLDPPDQVCVGGESVKLLRGQIEGEFFAVAEGDKERALRESTREVLVYFYPESRADQREAPCGPNYLDGAVGFGGEGRVLWFTALRGEDVVVARSA